jgi:hypothetical protein
MVKRTKKPLGPLSATLKCKSNWRDKYPAWQVYADECERLLRFLSLRGEVDRFQPRLRAKRQQRDEALNEIRVAHYLDSIGYPVVAWEPVDAPGGKVEFSVASEAGKPVFVEVKSPGWEAELTVAERQCGRAQRVKYLGMEARVARPIQVIRRTVEKARRKFSGKASSLIFICDDCFVSLGAWGWGPLQMALTQSTIGWGDGLFRDLKYANVGGVCLLWISRITDRRGIGWSSLCMANPNAVPTAALPRDLVAALCTQPLEPVPSIPSANS